MMSNIRLQQRPSGRRQFGQGMTEYIIIVALVAIAAIAVYSAFGGAVRGQMASITSQLGGGSGDAGNAFAGKAVTASTKEATVYNLNTYKTGAGNIKQAGN